MKSSRSSDTYLPHFTAIENYIDNATTCAVRPRAFFTPCLKASLAKCYEFNVAVRKNNYASPAFFWAPALRGMCEELIVLKFLTSLPRKDREKLIQLMMTHDVYTRINSQRKFFSASRPQQPVLTVSDAETIVAETRIKMRQIWNIHGWPNLKHGAMPQIRQIAEKLGQTALATLYDYLYRFTSGTVHFSVQSLLRSGWGNLPERCRFSTTHFHQYFSAFASVYGAFLFCVFFEFFGRHLRPPSKVSKIVAKIRHDLILEPRWPEMVTFEEMNLKPPGDAPIMRILFSAIQAQETKKLIN
jgi:hypothetical protein